MALRPTARGALTRAVLMLRAHWRPLLVVALVVFIPIGLLDVLDERFAELDPNELGATDVIGALAIGFSRVTTALFGEILLAGAIAAAARDVHGGERPTLGHLLGTIPYPRLVAITVLFVVGLGVGLLLLIVPGIIFLGLFALAAPLAEIEGLGVRAAFARSRELARGHLGLVLGVLVPLSILAEFAGEAAQGAGVWALGGGLAGEWVGAVAAGVLISTPWALAAVALVYELKAAEGGGGKRADSRSTPRRRR